MDFPCVLTMTLTAQEVWEAGFPFADAMLTLPQQAQFSSVADLNSHRSDLGY